MLNKCAASLNQMSLKTYDPSLSAQENAGTGGVEARAQQVFCDAALNVPLDVQAPPKKIVLGAENQELIAVIVNVAAEYKFADKTVVRLSLAINKHAEPLARLIAAADTPDANQRAIYANLLKAWHPKLAPQIDGTVRFLLGQSAEQMASHCAFFSHYGFYKLLQDEVEMHASLYYYSPADYIDFAERVQRGAPPSSLVEAARVNLYGPYVKAADAAQSADDMARLQQFIFAYAKHAGSLSAPEFAIAADCEACRSLLLWLADHASAWMALFAIDPLTLVKHASLHVSYQQSMPALILPELDVFILGCQKDVAKALKLIDFFGEISREPALLFQRWVAAHSPTICDELCKLEPKWIQANKETLSIFISLLNDAQTSLPEKELCSLLTVQKIEYLDTLCKWILAGHKELALEVCRVYVSKAQKQSRIGLLALKQDAETAKIVLLLTHIDESVTLYKLPRKCKRLNDRHKAALTNEILATICGAEGAKALAQWMLRCLGAHAAIAAEKYSLAKLLGKLSAQDRERTLRLCYLANNVQERAHLFEALATYPSLHFADLLLANPSRKFIKLTLAEIPNPQDLLRVIEVFTHICGNTRVPHRRKEHPLLGEPTAIVESLKKARPALKSVIDSVLKDSSKIARRIKVAMADWCRYNYTDALVTFFSHFPLACRMNAVGQMDPQQRSLWKAAVVRLECGRMGHIADVMTAIALQHNSLPAQAIEACRAFENPALLRQLLHCNIADAESSHILQNLIQQPEDSWYRFLLHIKTMEKDSSCQPYLNASPGTTNVYKRLIKGKRPHLAKLLASNRNFNYTARHLGLSSKVNLNPKANLSPIKTGWKRSDKLTRTAKKGKRTSLDAYNQFRENDIYIEQYKEVALALSMAQCLIPDALLPKSRLEQVLQAIPRQIVDTDHGEYLKNVLSFLHNSEDLCDKIVALDHSFHLCAEGVAIINGLLSRSPDHPVSMQEVRLALLSALLCRPSQVLDVGSCFATVEVIHLQSTAEGLSKTLECYKQILKHGKLTLFNNEKNAMQDFYVQPRLLELNLGLPLLHPLAKAFEYTMASLGNLSDKSRVLKARNEVFGKSGFLAPRLNIIWQNYKQMHPGVNNFDTLQLLRDMKRKFDELTLELFNPKIQIGKETFSGWELLLRNGLRVISDAQEYKSLYKEVIEDTLGAYYAKYSHGTLSHTLIGEIETGIVPCFDPHNVESEAVIEHLMHKLSLKAKTDLWQRDNGGNVGQILAGFQHMQRYPYFSFHVTSGVEAFHHLLQHCYNLPSAIKEIATKKKIFYLPMDLPSHCVNLLPHPLLALLEKFINPQSVISAIQADCSALAKKTPSIEDGSALLERISSAVHQQIGAHASKRFKEALQNHNLTGLCLQELAQLFLKEISLACVDQPPPLRTMLALIDRAIYHSLNLKEEIPLFVFADANWSGIEHNGTLLAFGWSFASDQLEVFVTNRHFKEVSLLSWNVIRASHWGLYATPQVIL